MTERLLGLRAENYMRIELLDIVFPDGGGAYSIMGANEAGKSSAINALEATLNGRKMAKETDKPIHTGADSAVIVATFDDIVVKRVYRANGTTGLTVTGADGRPVAKPEDALRKLYSHVGLDPLSFSRLSDEDQVARLLPLIGYDPKDDNEEWQESYDLRTVKGRDVTRLKGELTAYGDIVTGLPAEEVSVADLSAELSTALGARSAKATAEAAYNAAVSTHQRAASDVGVADVRVEEAEAALERARAAAGAAREESDRTSIVAGERKAEWEAMPDTVDTSALEAQIATAEDTNRKIRNAQARGTAAAALKTAEAEYAAFTAKIDAVEVRKAKALADATMPLPGLTIDPVTMRLMLNGEPFSQASTGVKIKTGTAIAMALQPDLRLIIIRDASLLDAGNREVINELAIANEFLVIMEIADESSEVGVVIEDGAVREVRS